MSKRFSVRLARQIEAGETKLLECWVNGQWSASKLRQWMTGARAILEKEYGPSSGIVQSFTAECGLRDIEQHAGWTETIEKCLEILVGIRQSVAPLGDEGE